MALPSRLGAFMVGTAVGAANCFYWLHEDVQTVQSALSRKIAATTTQVRQDQEQAALRLAAFKDALPNTNPDQPLSETAAAAPASVVEHAATASQGEDATPSS